MTIADFFRTLTRPEYVPPPSARRFLGISGVTGLAILVGLFALFGWIVDYTPIVAGDSELGTLRPNAALALIFLGLATVSGLMSRHYAFLKVLSLASAALTLLCGSLELLELVVTHPIGLDVLLRSHEIAVPWSEPLSLLLLGTSVLVVDPEQDWKAEPSECLALGSFLLTFPALIAHVLGAGQQETILAHTQLSALSSATLTFLAAGVLCLRPDRGLASDFCTETLGTAVIRPVMPLLLLGLPGLAWLRHQGELRGYWSTGSGLSLMISAAVVLSMSVFWRALSLLNGSEMALRRAEEHAEQAERELVVITEQGKVEQALRSAEERYRHIIDSVRDYAICLLDTSGCVATWNPGVERLMGFTQADIVGKRFAAFFPIGEVQACQRMLEEAARTGRAEREGNLLQKNGRPTWTHLLIAALRDPQGLVTGYSTVTRDLSEARRRETELVELNERLRISLKAAKAGSWTWNLDRNRLEWDEQMLEHFGITAGEFSGTQEGFLAQLIPEDRKRVKRDFECALVGENEFESEYKVKLKSGVVRILSSRGHVFCDSFGRAVRVAGICWDNTTNVRLQETLQESNFEFERLIEERRLIMDNVPALIAYLGADLECHFANSAFIDWFGVRAGAVVGASLEQLVGPELFGELKPAVDQALKGQAQIFERRIVRARDHSERYVQFCLTPGNTGAATTGSGAGKTGGFFAHAVDITAQKEAELRAVAATRFKSEFLANMSHEVRTPLNGIIGMAGLLADSQLDAREGEFAESIKRSSDSLLTIINDILDFSKVEAGKLELESIEFDMGQLLEDTVSAIRFVVGTKKLELRLEGAVSPANLLFGDPGRLRQVLTNLLGNAVKFTPQGHVTLRVREASAAVGHLGLRFDVEDTGIGIAKKAQSKLFEAFTQADSTTTRRFGGTGLGLSISKRLVELMGGRLGLVSEENQGSTFWFEVSFKLGAACSPADRREKRSRKARRERTATRPERILVAEDNPTNQRVAILHLQQIGFRADAVGNGVEVLQALEQVPYDLVLMDCQMPEMDGLEATRRIRATKGARYRDVPIVAMTASAMAGDRELCLESGMTDYVSKPIEPDALERVLDRTLGAAAALKRAPEAVATPAALATATSTAPSAPVARAVDVAVLRTLDQLGEPGKPLPSRDIVKVFLKSAPAIVKALRAELMLGQLDGLARHAHQLKSSSAALGGKTLSAHCLELEQLPAAESAARAPLLVARIEREFVRMVRELRDEFLKSA